MNLYRELSADEEREFRKWARDNYQPLSDISGLWHPVIQLECQQMNREASEAFSEAFSLV